MAATMRYRLRTLLIAAALGPPVLAIVWLAVPLIIDELAPHLFLAGMVISAVAIVFSAIAVPPRRIEAARLPLWQTGLLCCSHFVALWWWLYVWTGIGGWMVVWGDNGPPVSELTLSMAAAVAAALFTVLTILRIHFRLASEAYIKFVSSLTGILLAMASMFLVAYLQK